jgi:hypothetical protein
LPERAAGERAGAEGGAMRRGSIAHALLERADLAVGAPPPDAEAVRAAAAAIGERVDDAEIADQLRLAASFLEGPLRARAAAASRLRREVAFALELDPGPTRSAGSPLLNGVIDLLAYEPGGAALVIDHKTDRVEPGADLDALVERDYAIQRAVYALAVLRSGARSVELVHLYLERGEAASARFTADDRGRLEQLLRSSMAPLLAGEHPVCAEPHAGLCRRCPGRGGLCPHPPELTDRELLPLASRR